jgi:hypothetical protein
MKTAFLSHFSLAKAISLPSLASETHFETRFWRFIAVFANPASH